MVGAITAAVTLAGCSAGQQTASTSRPTSAAGEITFYLELPARASSLVNDALAAAMPGSSRYRRFSSVANLAAKYGASSQTIRADVKDVEKFGLRMAIDPSRLFARVSGTARQWASALGAPLSEQAASQSDPFTTYSLPARLPAGLSPQGTTWLFSDTKVYDPSADRHGSSAGQARGADAPRALAVSAQPWPKNDGTVGRGTCKNQAITNREVYTPRHDPRSALEDVIRPSAATYRVPGQGTHGRNGMTVRLRPAGAPRRGAE